MQECETTYQMFEFLSPWRGVASPPIKPTGPEINSLENALNKLKESLKNGNKHILVEYKKSSKIGFPTYEFIRIIECS